jgi:predicted transposase YdaD
MLSDQEKLEIEEELHMQYHFDEFIDENPVVLERVARSEAQGEARGEARGKIEGLRESIVSILAIRFSVLAAIPQTQQALAHIQDIETLKQLQQELILAPDEPSARALLKLPVQRDLL